MATSFFGGAFFAGEFFNGSGPTPPPAVQPSGGYYDPPRKRRTKEDVRADRIRLGILQEPKAAEAVREVAKTVIEAQATPLALKADEQTDMLRSLLLDEGFRLTNKNAVNLALRQAIAAEVEGLQEERAIVQLLYDM